jgi:hypothetical protein
MRCCTCDGLSVLMVLALHVRAAHEGKLRGAHSRLLDLGMVRHFVQVALDGVRAVAQESVLMATHRSAVH